MESNPSVQIYMFSVIMTAIDGYGYRIYVVVHPYCNGLALAKKNATVQIARNVLQQPKI